MLNHSQPGISTILFDLGGVLYDINLRRTRDSLMLLAGRDIEFQLTTQDAVFDEFETGAIPPDVFRNRLRSLYGITADDTDIDAAWNALLIGMIPGRVELLRALKPQYRLALLSNINPLHHERIRSEVEEAFAEFEHCFLSYEMGLRKPDVRIFSRVLDTLGVAPQNLLFIDDSPQHIAAAETLGIATYHVTPVQPLVGLFS
ncbi:MAG: HAD family phosphatase [Candidatus Kapabacteria bacterium]|nr:HAD family phosphatase [Candidatus Kapabacteria bacterium]